MAPTDDEESLTAKRRRDQVLTAAEQCVRQEGFHRASLSRISAAAGMSSGHIYHYFGSKEAIIAGIVERGHNEMAEMVDEVREASRATDALTALAEQAPKSAQCCMDRDQAALSLEILAESARNPRVAALIQSVDEQIRQSFYDLLGDDSPEMQARCELVSALFEGLSCRALRYPESAGTMDMALLQRVVRYVLSG